jgi:hypothetical protein
MDKVKVASELMRLAKSLVARRYSIDEIRVGDEVLVDEAYNDVTIRSTTRGVVLEVLPSRREIIIKPYNNFLMDKIRYSIEDVSEVKAAYVPNEKVIRLLDEAAEKFQEVHGRDSVSDVKALRGIAQMLRDREVGKAYATARDLDTLVRDYVPEQVWDYMMKGVRGAVGKVARVRRWHNVPGVLEIEVSDLHPSVRRDVEKLLPPGTEVRDWDLVIEFESSGTFDPGVQNPVENAYPAETDEKRELVRMTLVGANGRVAVKGRDADGIFDDLIEKVRMVDLGLADF